MFEIQNTNNSTQFKVASTESLEQPKNGKFYAVFNRSHHTINILGYGGQVLSGITEFLAVYGLFEDWRLGTIFGLFAVFLFEVVGLRIVLKTLIRSIVRREYKSKHAKFLIVLLVFIFGGLLYKNIDFSLTGNKFAFHQKEDNTTHNRVFALDSLMNVELSKIESEYHKKDSTEFERIEAAKESTTLSYSNTIKSLNG